MAGALGADVGGVDLSRPLDDATFAAIERALHQHLVIFFHDQQLTPEQHLALTRRFGPISRSPYIKHMDAYPDIIAVLKEAEERKISTFGNAWHSDFSFLEEPPLGSVLYAREVPSHGGDTLFANMYAAYEALSPGLRRVLDGLNAIHTGRPYGVGGLPQDLAVSRARSASNATTRRRIARPRTQSRACTRRPDARPCSSTASTRRGSRA
jgi:taurine dioxygenase